MKLKGTLLDPSWFQKV